MTDFKNPNPNNLTLKEAAMLYGSLGLNIFPLLPGSKDPIKNSGGFYDGTSDLRKIKEWWTENPEYNIGLWCKDFCALDFDLKTEGDKKFELFKSKLPKTIRSKTGGGGIHLLYKNLKLEDKKEPGFEVKSRKGYIVLPPSVHPGSGKKYQWMDEFDLTKVVDAPGWVNDYFQNKKNENKKDVQSIVVSSNKDNYNSPKKIEDQFYAFIRNTKQIDLDTTWGLKEIIGSSFEIVNEDAKGIYIRSPYSSSYSTPETPKDILIYLGWGVGVLHAHDSEFDNIKLYDFCEKYRRDLIEEFEKQKELFCSKISQNFSYPSPDKGSIPVQDTGPASLLKRSISLDSFFIPKSFHKIVSLIKGIVPIVPNSCIFGSALSFCGSLIGKRVYYTNMGATIYGNISTIGILDTGNGKSNLKQIYENLLLNKLNIHVLADLPTGEVLLKSIGKTISTKDKEQKISDNSFLDWCDQVMMEQRERLYAHLIIGDEITGTLDYLLGSGDSVNKLKNLEKVLQVMDSGSTVRNDTITHGYTLIHDNCFSIFGFTQSQTWNEKYGAEKYLNSGFIGRFLIFTENLNININKNNDNDKQKELNNLIYQIYNFSKTFNKEEIKFDLTNTESEDFILDVKNKFAETKIFKEFISKYGNKYLRIKNKIIIKALQMSLIFYVLHKMEGSNICFNDIYSNCFMLTAFTMLAFFDSCEFESEESLQLNILKDILSKHPGLCQSKIRKKFTQKYRGNLTAILELGLDLGEIKMTTFKRPQGGTYIQYFLTEPQ